MKNIYNRLLAVFLGLVISFSSVIIPCFSVHAGAALPAIPALVNYVLTAVGVVEVADGIVDSISQGEFSNLSDLLTTLLGDGSIYINSNGDYVFNSDATKAIYETLLNDDSIDAKVVASFPDYRTYSAEGFNTSYISSDFISAVENVKLSFSGNYIGCFQQFTLPNGSTETNTYTYFIAFDVSNFSFFGFQKDSGSGFVRPWLTSYNSNGALDTSNKSFKVVYCTYNSRTGFSLEPASNKSYYHLPLFINRSSYPLGGMYVSNDVDFLSLFPEYNYVGASASSSGGNLIYYTSFLYSNRSIVISDSAVSGNSLANQNTGIVYNNFYDIIPSVSQDVIENNNWENIYNSYVTNVNNEYQTIYDDSGFVSADDLRSILKDIGDRIDDIISDAGREIIDNLEDVLSWLSRIYDRLGLIEVGLSDVYSSQSDIYSVVDDLKDIVDSYSTDLARLQQIYVVLGNILTALNSGGGGSGGINNDIVIDVPSLTSPDVLDLIDKGDILASALESVVPFCFIPFFGVLVNSLSSEPSEAPNFIIPFKLNNAMVDIDIEQEISLDWLDGVHNMYVAMWCILLIIYLVFITFKLFHFINTMI